MNEIKALERCISPYSTNYLSDPHWSKSAYLGSRILQDQGVQGDGAEHAGLPCARLSLYDQIWNNRWIHNLSD